MKTITVLLLLFPVFIFAQSPGGVGTTNLKLWNKADAGVTGTSPITAWADQTATNTFTITGNPVLQSAALNYNPTVLFDGNSRFTGNTAVTNITQAFAVGKIASGGVSSGALIGTTTTYGSSSAQYFFHTESNNVYSAGNATTTFSYFANSSNAAPYSIFTEDLSKTPAAADMMRLNGVDKANPGADPAVIVSATPTIGSRVSVSTPLNISANSEIAEAILFNTSLTTTQVNQVESYLAVKYGITLGSNYVNSANATIYNQSTYGSNIIGIARDDNSALSQKQSHQSDDATRIYLGTLAANNSANAGTFSSNAQFVMMGNNNATLANNTGNTEYPASAGIINRMNREWKITNTGFTGSFSIDITPTAGTYDAKRLRLLVDDDGDFSNGGNTVYPASISYAGGTISVSNITTAIIPAGSTRYITLATVASPGGVSSDNLHLWVRADAGVVTSGANVSQWVNQSPVSMTVQPSKTATSNVTLNSNDFNYNPTLVFDGANNQRLTGTFASIPSGIAMMFAVTKKSLTPNANLGSPYTLGGVGAAGAPGIGYAASNSAYGADFDGGVCRYTTDVRDIPSIVRVDYASTANVAGAVTALNGLLSGSTPTCGTSNLLRTANGNFEVGGRSYGSQPTRVFAGQIAEVIHFNADNLPNTTADVNKIETYLAVKYGLTLDNSVNGTLGGNYTSSAGSTVWDAAVNSGYHRQIIGIGRDDNTALLQKQSHTADDTTRIYLSSLQTANVANDGSFSSDGSFVLVGNNAGEMFSTGSTEFPTGQGIYTRLDREWKITNTNYTGTFSMDFTPKYTNVTATDLRVLIDADGDFSNATMYNPTITFNSGIITVSGINNTMIPSGATRYLTLVSLDVNTPLPVSLISFNAKTAGATVELNWQTASEYNNAFFAVERSADGQNWQQIGKVDGAGNSSQLLNYSYTDVQPLNGVSYYRLKQTDNDGSFKYSVVRVVRLQEETSLRLYPNPVSNEVIIEGNRMELQKLKVFDQLGRDVTQRVPIRRSNETQVVLNVSSMPEGLYIIRVKNKAYKVIKK